MKPHFACLVALLGGLIGAGAVRAEAIDDAVELVRRYVRSQDARDKAALREQATSFTGDLNAVLAAAARRTYPAAKPGFYEAQRFTRPELAGKYDENHLLYVRVPEKYDPARPWPLVVYLHGGGISATATSPRRYLAPQSVIGNAGMGDLLAELGFLAIAPAAPPHNSPQRWCSEVTTAYLADVILEAKHRFHVDDDRVLLIGHSLGGLGAYHHIQQQPDRFSLVIAGSGAWNTAFWPVTRGALLAIVHGTHDQEFTPGGRGSTTAVQYARQAHDLLTKLDIPHQFYEYNGGHAWGPAMPWIRQLLIDNADRRRDPAFPRVALASPIGFRSTHLWPVKHNRWLTLDAADPEGRIELTEIHIASPEQRKPGWDFSRRAHAVTGSVVEAANEGNNTFRIEARGVRQFTLWLRREMVDFTRPVTVIVNRVPLHQAPVQPSLATALESYDRRHDWGLIYPAKITIQVAP